MKIYVDVLVLENSLVNFFLLTLTMKAIKHKCKTSLLILSCFIGGMYTLVLLIPKLSILSYFPCELVVAYIMIRIVYGKTSVANNIKAVFVFFMITFTLSGICFLLSLKQNIYLLGSSFKIEKYSVKYIILSLITIYLIYNRIIEYIRDKLFINNYIFELQFEVAGKNYSVKSFLDTGNELREPVTNLPCILVENMLIDDIDFNDSNSYRILYSAVGYGGELRGVRVNNIKLKNKKKVYEGIDAIICPCKEKLSKECEFNALLSRGIVFEGGYINGEINSVF